MTPCRPSLTATPMAGNSGTPQAAPGSPTGCEGLDVEQSRSLQSRLHVLEPTFFANGAEVGGVRERALGSPTHSLAHRGAWRRRAGRGSSAPPLQRVKRANELFAIWNLDLWIWNWNDIFASLLAIFRYKCFALRTSAMFGVRMTTAPPDHVHAARSPRLEAPNSRDSRFFRRALARITPVSLGWRG
jgi:hypothetical protein